MIVIRGKIPIAIHPFFWLFSAIIGWMYTQSIVGILVWMFIIFISVLVHEFGHALTAIFFKQKVSIQLVALGGVTSYEGPALKFWQQFLITLNGPLFGFILYVIAAVLLQIDLFHSSFILTVLALIKIANLFWTIVNLLPVLPLDGGQLLRIGLEAAFGLKGFRASLWIGSVLAGLLAVYFFIVGAFLIGALFFLFGFQTFDTWRKSKFTTMNDREDENQKLLQEGERAFYENRQEEALSIFERLRGLPSGGVISLTATQYLAFLKVKQGKQKEAYELLQSHRQNLSPEALSLLHQLASSYHNPSLVAELASECYQLTPNQEVALRNARAFASLKQGKAAGGWLQSAWQYGGLDKETLLHEEVFVQLQHDADFQEFVDRLI
jgi:Zn-dependent protease